MFRNIHRVAKMIQNHKHYRIYLYLFLLIFIAGAEPLTAQDNHYISCRMTNVLRHELTYRNAMDPNTAQIRTDLNLHIKWDYNFTDTLANGEDFILGNKKYSVSNIVRKSGFTPENETMRYRYAEGHEILFKNKKYLCLAFDYGRHVINFNFYVVIIDRTDTNNLKMYAFPSAFFGIFNRIHYAGLKECLNDFNNDGKLDFWSWDGDPVNSAASNIKVYTLTDKGIKLLPEYYLRITRNYEVNLDSSHWFFKLPELKPDPDPLYSKLKLDKNIFDSVFIWKKTLVDFLDTTRVFPVEVHMLDDYMKYICDMASTTCYKENDTFFIGLSGFGPSGGSAIHITLVKGKFNISVYESSVMLGAGNSYLPYKQNLILRRYPEKDGDVIEGIFSFSGTGTPDERMLLHPDRRLLMFDEQNVPMKLSMKGAFRCVVSKTKIVTW